MWGDESVVKMEDRTCGGNTTNCSGLDIDAETSSTGLCPTYPAAVFVKIDAYDEAKGKVQISYHFCQVFHVFEFVYEASWQWQIPYDSCGLTTKKDTTSAEPHYYYDTESKCTTSFLVQSVKLLPI